jgi:hypothetical protein
MTHRSRPSRSAIGTPVEIPDLTADPYAYFLEKVSRINYAARLSERGLNSEAPPDRGHPFELTRHTVHGALQDIGIRRNGVVTVRKNTLLHGDIPSSLNYVHGGTVQVPAPYKETNLDNFAQGAYARAAPTAVIFDAGQFGGELREGFPQLSGMAIKNSVDFFRSLGNGYLASEFGWKPFIRDLQNLGKALMAETESFSMSGKPVHRIRSTPDDTTAGTVTHEPQLTGYVGAAGLLTPDQQKAVFGSPLMSTGSLYDICSQTVTKTRTVKRWFEGMFTYYLPLTFDPTDYFSKVNQLINGRLTPATLWELSPWSWLVDWDLKIGDSLKANELASDDHLIMHYGYAMEHSIYTTEVSWRLRDPLNTSYFSQFPLKGGYLVKTEYKRRIRANPYGFKVASSGGLSASQLAILGALGLKSL